MANTPAYPNDDIARTAEGRTCTMARIVAVEPNSPAYEAGFEAGCFITSVDGQPMRDVIEWRWLADGQVVTVGYIDLDGEAGEVELWREPDEDWGLEFEGLVFDDVKQCRNACTFCFMRQLPADMRDSLYLRDDDFRLSFLVGTFVTLTNLTAEDEARIIAQRISPLRVSLQASNPEVRRHLMGKHAQHGLDALERLLAAGIEFHAQIVLVPGENDGEVLAETLSWAYERPGILGIGIVPLGYTRHQAAFDRSFNDAEASRALLDLIAPFQERALEERETPWVYAADEFYRNAWGADLLDHLPSTGFYGDFSMFEDGIGVIRSTVDDWEAAEQSGVISVCAERLRAAHKVAYLVSGFAQQEFLDPLVSASGIADVFRPLYVANTFFGGNVDVTGLLTGQDIANAIARLSYTAFHPEGLSEAANRQGRSGSEDCLSPRSGRVPQLLRPFDEREPQRALRDGTPCATVDSLFLILRVVFNDDGLTLDDMTLQDMETAAGQPLHVVSCSPLEYFRELSAILAG